MIQKFKRAAMVAEYQLVARFEEVKQKLLQDSNHPYWEKPLAFWALPTDRRLPLALLGWSLRNVVQSTYDRLCTTPGIGPKKMSSLVTLLERVLDQKDSQVAPTPALQPVPLLQEGEANGAETLQVSELTWSQWCQSIERHRLARQPLGRFTDTLKKVPRVIWTSALGDYTSRTLKEIHNLKTHGTKRVNNVLEVVASLAGVLNKCDEQSSLTYRPVPKSIAVVEEFLLDQLQTVSECSAQAVKEQVLQPVLDQLCHDAGDEVATLAGLRLGLESKPVTVSSIAQMLGISRARVYQILSEIALCCKIRWPQGGALLQALKTHLQDLPGMENTADQLHRAAQLFYPREPGDAGLEDSMNGEQATTVDCVLANHI